MSDLNFSSAIEYNATQIIKFDDYLDKILDLLKIKESNKNNLIEFFNKYKNETYRLLESKEAEITALLNADEALQTLLTNDNLKHYFTKKEIQTAWEGTMNELAKLQGLIIIRKTKKGCESTMDTIINALNTKIEVANNLLEAEL